MTNPLDRWLTEVGEALGVDPDLVDVKALLDVTREVAHSVARPAGPLTTFLLGVAVGQHGTDPGAAVRAVTDMIRTRTESDPTQPAS